MKWIGQHIYDLVSRFRNDVIIEDSDGSSITMKAGSTNAALGYSYPLQIFQPVNDASPTINLGSSNTEKLSIRAFYQSGTQEMQVASFSTATAESDADRGKFQFTVDGANIVGFLDDGIDLFTGKGISINGTDILTDSSGTATLSNIDALDATTIATFETAMEANLDTFGSQMTSASSLATIGTITTGVWQGTAIASAYLDADTAHLSGNQTFTGNKNFTGNSTTFSSATADSPLIQILNTTDDDQAAQLVFNKLRDDDAVAQGQNLGEIWFKGQNSAAAATNYGVIFSEIDVSTHGQESGKLNFGVTAHDGDIGVGLILTGGSVDAEIDVEIGKGASSVVTIPGDIDLAGDIDVDGTLETDALTIGGVTVAAAGTASINTLGTITTGTWRGTAVELGSGGTGLVGATDGKIVIADGDGAPVLLDVGTSTAIETLGTIGTGVWNATAIASAKMATASASAQGAVELATTAEADTGTDTARAVTPEGLKSHVNARYARSTISFVGLATMLSSGNWVTTGGNGISNHTWNQDVGVNTKTNGTSAGSLAKQYGHMGVRVPYACVIENIYASIRNAGGNRQVTVGLFCARAADGTTAVDWGTTDATEPVLQIHADANNESGSYQNRPTHAEASGGVVMAAGDLFYPAMKLTGVTSGGNTDIVQASFTVGIKTLIA